MQLIERTLENITTTINALNKHDRELLIITTNENDATKSYLKNKIKVADKFGINTQIIELQRANSTELQMELIRTELRKQTNHQRKGLIIQLPLANLTTKHVTSILDEFSSFIDVDGLRTSSKQAVAIGDIYQLPATALGIYTLIKNYTSERKHIAVLGQSDLVTKPLAKVLIDDRHTVISMNSLSDERVLLYSDIVILATGNLQKFRFENTNRNALVVDVGIGRVDDKLCGEWIHTNVDKLYNIQITPVPNGVGRLTTHCLILKLVML